MNATRDYMEEIKKYKIKRVVSQVSQTNRFALYLGIRVDLMLEWDLDRMEENHDWISREFKKYKFKRVVAQVTQTDRFRLYLDIRVDLMLEWDS
ncbi:uncharacterized protein G2W53_004383 [Senna tora]|uniref:Uncharacterized protein n=1 Tax=Senna tora TaxID=362788 RepID=A0A835CJB0_9FABA|nr:uncharacterized protein G2W53_004383 [Senna tora]